VRDDIPFAWPRGELSRLFFPAACLAVGALIAAIGRAEPVDQRLAVAGLLLAMAAGSFIFFSRGYRLHVGLLIAFIMLALLTGSAGLLLFALCPLAYMTLPVRAGHVFVVLYSLTPTATYLIRTGDARLTLTMYLPLGVGSAVVAIFAARWFLRMRELAQELATARERQRLAGEIHDTIAQGLSSVVMLLDAAMLADAETARKHMGLAIQTARENLHEARALVGALTPAPLTETSLTDALQRLAARCGAGFTVTGAARHLRMGTEVMLLRVAQEALNNTQRHAGASATDVALAFEPSLVALEVRDDGVGFAPDSVLPGYGLGGMRSRVEQAGGKLTIRTAPGSGTVVRTEVAP
jgi:signal transduction histidine kinase